MSEANFAHQAILRAFDEDDVETIRRRFDQGTLPRRLQLTNAGKTLPLFHTAARCGALNCVRFLVDAGFPRNDLNHDGQKAWEVAKTPEIAQLLKGYDRVALAVSLRAHVTTRRPARLSATAGL